MFPDTAVHNGSHVSHQEEEFEEDMGLYDDLHLEEEEEKFGLANDDNEGSDNSDAQSEGKPMLVPNPGSSDLVAEPPQRSSKKHDKDEESVASGSRRDDSPIQKKAGVGIQLRSECQVACMLRCLNDVVQRLRW